MSNLYLDSVTPRDRSTRPKAYPFTVPAIRQLERLEFRTRITLFAGDNGSGKSTLLEGLAAGMRAYAIGNHGQVIDDPYLSFARPLADTLRLARRHYPKVRMFLRAEDVLGYVRHLNEERLDNYRDMLKQMRAKGADAPEETPDVFRSIIASNEIDSRSHGEGFLDILSQRLHGGGLYFLDEPESPLSPIRQLELAEHIRRTAEDGAQFIIATHSPVLLAIPEATIFHFSETGIREMLFDELESIAFLRRFLDRPGRYLDP